MRTILLVAALVAVGLRAAPAAEQMESPKEMAVLTVAGEIANTNRGPFDPKSDSLLAILKLDFERAFTFDRPMLLRLKQGTVRAKPPEFDEPAIFSGPLLKEVLATVGASPNAKVRFVAADGYAGWLMPDDIQTSDWILALTANGAPLGLGQQGPIWMLNTRGEGEAASEDHRGHWVWALIFIRVGE